MMERDPPCTPYTQSLDNSTTTDKTFAERSSWEQGPAVGLLHSHSLGPHPIAFCRQMSPIP